MDLNLLAHIADKIEDGSKNKGPDSKWTIVKAMLENHALLGEIEQDQVDVQKWITFYEEHFCIEKEDDSKLFSSLMVVNSHLISRTYFVGNHISAADIVAFAQIHPFMTRNAQNRSKLLAISSVVRHFDLIQHIIPNIEKFTQIVPIDLNVPFVAKKPSAQKTKPTDSNDNGKENAPSSDGNNEKKINQVKSAPESKRKDEKNKKESKEDRKSKREKDAGKPQAQTQELSTLEVAVDPSRLDIRIGFIQSCKKHESADSLYVEEIDVGEEAPRTVVSGLVNHVPIEKMQERYVVMLCNLKPASMRGVKSHAMVMCTTGSDGKVEILEPPKGSQPGDRVFFDGFIDGKPDEVLNPKKKVWESIQPHLKTNQDCIATFVRSDNGTVCQMKTDKGVIKSITVQGGSIK